MQARADANKPQERNLRTKRKKRREGDSNSRYLAVRRFSKPVQSTTLPSLRRDKTADNDCFEGRLADTRPNLFKPATNETSRVRVSLRTRQDHGSQNLARGSARFWKTAKVSPPLIGVMVTTIGRPLPNDQGLRAKFWTGDIRGRRTAAVECASIGMRIGIEHTTKSFGVCNEVEDLAILPAAYCY